MPMEKQKTRNFRSLDAGHCFLINACARAIFEIFGIRIESRLKTLGKKLTGRCRKKDFVVVDPPESMGPLTRATIGREPL